MTTRRITNVRYSGTVRTHETLSEFKWVDSLGTIGNNTKAGMVAWLDAAGTSAHVGTGPSRVEVAVVRTPGVTPHLRTHADGKYNNNLLSLPLF